MNRNSVKFSAFADLHHWSGFYINAPDRLAKIQKRAENENVDFIIHLGDFCSESMNSDELLKQYREFNIPSYHIFGNHDNDHAYYMQTLEKFTMPASYYYFDNNGFRFVILDPNYFRIDDEYIHYENSNYFAHGDCRDWLPPAQIDWLEETVMTSPYMCVILSHESFERENDGVKNYMEVRKLIRRANSDKRRVLMCINGHHHKDSLRIIDNVAYFDLNSCSYDWIDKPHNFYPKELCEKHLYMKHTLIYNDPVHAIITLTDDGTIEINGMESTMYMGITKEMTENPPCDKGARRTTPNVLSAKFKLE